jgi:hypothetical protein
MRPSSTPFSQPAEFKEGETAGYFGGFSPSKSWPNAARDVRFGPMKPSAYQ